MSFHAGSQAALESLGLEKTAGVMDPLKLLWTLGVHAGGGMGSSGRGGYALPALLGAGLGGAAGAAVAPEGEKLKGFGLGALAGVGPGLLLKPALHQTGHWGGKVVRKANTPANSAQWGLQELLEQIGVRPYQYHKPDFNTSLFKTVAKYPHAAMGAMLGAPAAAAAGAGALASNALTSDENS